MPLIQEIIAATGGTNFVPQTRTLSINGVTYDLTADRSWTISTSGVGTVTSVGLASTMPTGLTASISGSPITSSGTLNLNVSFASGYSIPTTIKQGQWDDAYSFVTGFPVGTEGQLVKFDAFGDLLAFTPNFITNPMTSGGDMIYGNAVGLPLRLPPNTTTTKKFLSMTGDGINGDQPFWDTITAASLGAVPSTRTITINGTTFDLSANRTYNVGTVTSVGLSSSTSGVTIGSTPITTSGTITLSIATATASTDGLLSSTDWSAFTAKLNNPFSAALGQMIYSNAAGAPLSLAPNTTTTKKYLSMTGDGTNGSGPVWEVISLADVSGAISRTSLSATSPLLYNNTTGVFSIQQASNLQSGFLSDANWTTFNSKQTQITLTTTGSSGASTFNFSTGALNVPEYTLAGLGGLDNPMTSLGDMIYSNASGAPQRLSPNTSTTRKYLSMIGVAGSGSIPTWETIDASVGGSGTTNYIAKFTSSSAIGNSLIFDNGTNVGIGTATPSSKLDVVGSGTISGIASLGISEITNLAYIGDRNTLNTRYIKFNRASALTNIVNIQGVNGGVGADNIAIQAEGGNLGIGTTSMSGKLHVQAATTGTSLYLTDAVNSTFYITHPSAARTSFYNGSNTRWLTEFGGDLGLEGSVVIGGVTPLARLHVKGGILSTGDTGFMVAATLTNGRLETYDSGSCQAIHTHFDNQTYEISAGSTSGWVSGLVITGRNATLNPDRVGLYTRSTLRLQVNGLGQLNLQNYTTSTSFTGTPVAYLACDAIGNIITSNPTSVGRNTRITFSAEVPNTWLNMPAALSFFDSSTGYVTQADLTDYNQVRLIVNKQGTAGSTGSKIILRYQPNTGAPFTASSYLDIATTEVSVFVDVSNDILIGGWYNMVSGAKDDVWVSIFGIDGDDLTDPNFGNIYAEFRYNP